jgi:hypothetical protein
MVQFTRITKRQAMARFNKGLPFYLCPCKLRPGWPWNFAILIANSEDYREDANKYRDNPTLWKDSVEQTAWELLYNNWAYYNTSYEMGYYAHYYYVEN